jgi:hypothetical protein
LQTSACRRACMREVSVLPALPTAHLCHAAVFGGTASKSKAGSWLLYLCLAVKAVQGCLESWGNSVERLSPSPLEHSRQAARDRVARYSLPPTRKPDARFLKAQRRTYFAIACLCCISCPPFRYKMVRSTSLRCSSTCEGASAQAGTSSRRLGGPPAAAASLSYSLQAGAAGHDCADQA